MKGNINEAAWALGFCLLVASCTYSGPSRVEVEIVNPQMITPEYCAGLKFGEAVGEILQ
jgi:hypothetical protein